MVKIPLDLDKDKEVRVFYRPHVPSHTLTVRAFTLEKKELNVGFRIDDSEERTPFSERLTQGKYTLTFPDQITVDEEKLDFDSYKIAETVLVAQEPPADFVGTDTSVIQKALDFAEKEEIPTVHVSQGVYSKKVDLELHSDLTLEGDGMGKTIIEARLTCQARDPHPKEWLKNLTLRGMTVRTPACSYLWLRGVDGLLIDNFEAYHTTHPGGVVCAGGGAPGIIARNFEIKNFHFHDTNMEALMMHNFFVSEEETNYVCAKGKIHDGVIERTGDDSLGLVEGCEDIEVYGVKILTGKVPWVGEKWGYHCILVAGPHAEQGKLDFVRNIRVHDCDLSNLAGRGVGIGYWDADWSAHDIEVKDNYIHDVPTACGIQVHDPPYAPVPWNLTLEPNRFENVKREVCYP